MYFSMFFQDFHPLNTSSPLCDFFLNFHWCGNCSKDVIIAFVLGVLITSREGYKSSPTCDTPQKAPKEQKYFKASRILFWMNSKFHSTKKPKKATLLDLKELFIFFYSRHKFQKTKAFPESRIQARVSTDFFQNCKDKRAQTCPQLR